MTAAWYPVIRCDGPGCDAETGGHVDDRTITQVRSYRKPKKGEPGWHVRPKGRDICPDCWKDGHR